MPDKQRLDALLSTPASLPPLKRGQGIRLSTDPHAVPEQAAALDDTTSPAAAASPDDATPTVDLRAQTHKRTGAQAHKRTQPEEASAPDPVVRISQGLRLRADLLKDLKLYAVQADRKLYDVMEEAIEQYLAQRRHHEQ